MQKYILLLLLLSCQAFAQTPRIINGTAASTQIYPWLVNYQRCSGTLIAPRWVLTAAHCFSDLNAEELPKLILRSDNILELDPEAIQARVIQIIPHPYFYNFDSDLALLKLAEPVNEVPVVTLRAGAHLDEDIKIIALGWGDTASDSEGNSINASDTLLQTGLALKNNGFCSEHFGPGITDNMLCVSGLSDLDRSDTCQGDSGGPIVMDSAGGFVQIGVTSFGGKPCGKPGVPAVYTRISQFQDWIKQYVPEAKFDNTTNPEFPNACKTVADNELNLDIPCAIYKKQIYHINLLKVDNRPIAWKLNSNSASNCPTNPQYCTDINDDLSLQIRNATYNNHTYQARLLHAPDKNSHYWTYESPKK